MAKRPKAAVVVGTWHDLATAFIAPAAERVSRLLRAHPRYEQVFTFIGIQKDKYVTLNSELQKMASDYEIEFGFFCAHGCSKGLWEREPRIPNKALVFDEALCAHFSNALLVMASCMKYGREFCETITNLSQIRAVIAYDEYLVVPHPSIKTAMEGSFEKYREEFLAALMQPVFSHLFCNADPKSAVRHGKSVWELSENDNLMDPRLRAVNRKNRDYLCHWENGQRLS